MRPTLPLEQMSVEEKILTMESLWDSLCQQTEDLESPGWHGDLLADRVAAVERGEAHFDDWETAKRNIRKQVS